MLNKQIACLAVMIGLAASVSACNNDSNGQPMTPQMLQSVLEKDLAKGISAADAEAYLVKQGYEQSGLIDNKTQGHLGVNPEAFEIRAIIRNTRKSMLVKTDMAIRLEFDREQKLSLIEVKEAHTGL
jgi:uncharacterized protein YllA (UPF0747 family)